MCKVYLTDIYNLYYVILNISRLQSLAKYQKYVFLFIKYKFLISKVMQIY